MSRFNFRLQRVLELREQHEQAVATRLAAAQDEADRQRRAHEALCAVREAGAERVAAAHAGVPTIGELQNLGYALQQLDAQVSASGHVVQSAEATVMQVQGELAAAFQARRVIDRLKEKQQDQWRAGEAQADRHLMDDIALSRFVQSAAAKGQGAE